MNRRDRPFKNKSNAVIIIPKICPWNLIYSRGLALVNISVYEQL